MKPTIGVVLDFIPDVNATMSRGIPNQTIVATTKATMSAFQDSGAICMGLGEARSVEEAMDVCKSIDALVVPGGPDIFPPSLGNPLSRYNGTMCPEKDDSDIKYINAMYNLDKPILGICRGMQLMSSVREGTILEDISHCTQSKIVHTSPFVDEWYRVHAVNLENGSAMAKIFGTLTINVNSFHHQSVLKPGKGFKCTGKSDDGIVECIEDERGKWLGVQWHPEYLYSRYPFYKSIFEYFVKMVDAYK